MWFHISVQRRIDSSQSLFTLSAMVGRRSLFGRTLSKNECWFSKWAMVLQVVRSNANLKNLSEKAITSEYLELIIVILRDKQTIHLWAFARVPRMVRLAHRPWRTDLRRNLFTLWVFSDLFFFQNVCS